MPPAALLPPPGREERRLFQEEWLVDQQEAALEAERARLQAALGVGPSPLPPRQEVGQWEGQPHGMPAGAGDGGQRAGHGLPFLPPVWEDLDAASSLEQGQMSGLAGGSGGATDSSGYELGNEGGPGVAPAPAGAPGERPPRFD